MVSVMTLSLTGNDAQVEAQEVQEIRSTANLATLAALEDRLAYLSRPCTDFALKVR